MEKDLDYRTVEGYNAMYAGIPKSKTLLHIWRDVYGDDYPEEVEPFSLGLFSLSVEEHDFFLEPGDHIHSLISYCGYGITAHNEPQSLCRQ